MNRFLLVIVALLVAGCGGMYYGAMEKVGIHKREILVDRIDDARDSQQEAKEQFQSTLDRFRSVVSFDGGDLEDLYDDLSAEFERSEKRAAAVRERIDEVEDVAEALFEEWEDELDEYKDAKLRRRSAATLADTQFRYDRLISAMRRAESRLNPVLDTFRDQVLFLKHNLNARAVASLKTELSTIETGVDRLIKEMNRSIDEAESFIASMES